VTSKSGGVMAEPVRGISVVKGTEGREGGNSSGSGSIDKDHSLSVKTVSEFRALPVDPLVTFLAEATRYGHPRLRARRPLEPVVAAGVANWY
jgi:hypothetical protein